MAHPLFPQNVIAVIWDFDKTLLGGYMQEPLFTRFGVDGRRFWAEVNALPGFYRAQGHELISVDTIYLSHILSYVRAGRFGGLNNQILRELGGELTLYPGMPEFLGVMKSHVEDSRQYKRHEITVEHYVVSTGLRQTILGSPVAPYVEDVWACEFLEHVAGPDFLDHQEVPTTEEPVLRDVGYSIDNTTKTRAVFEINKGVNKHPEDISVNDTLAHEDRRVPFENMIYIADGPSDVPVFSILNQYGGKTLGVYNPDSDAEFRQVARLQEQKRIQAAGPADYTERSHSVLYLLGWLDQIAGRIQARRERALGDRVGKPPEHLVEKPKPVEAPQDVAESVPEATPVPTRGAPPPSLSHHEDGEGEALSCPHERVPSSRMSRTSLSTAEAIVTEVDETLREECRELAAAIALGRERAERLQELADRARDQAARDEHALRELRRTLGLDPQLALESLDERLRGQRLMEIAVQVLAEHHPEGQPVHYREWYALLRGAGYLVGGKDPVATFLASVSRAPHVRSVGGRSGLYLLIGGAERGERTAAT